MNLVNQEEQLDDLHGDLNDKKATGEDVNPIPKEGFFKRAIKTARKTFAAENKAGKIGSIVKNIISPFIPSWIVKASDGIGDQLKDKTMANSKGLTKSKTIITAILVGLAGLGAIFGIIPEEAVSPDAGWVATAVAVVMFALRLVTKEPVQLGGS